VSHDLRAPLRAINGYAEILKEDYSSKLNDEGNWVIECIKYNATKMGALIDDLLTFSRLGKKELQKTKINMNELVEGALIDIDKILTHNAKIKIGKLHKVNADYGLLHQVVFNLISNAIKYSSKKEEPVIEISSVEKSNEITFSIKDNGAGFDMKYVDKLFGVFQRLHSQEEFEGTGVGLAIVQRIVAKHGGRVWAKGKVDTGATFSFTLTKS
jgi:light-regulated signal transduction histidine kinase (bacteriophytochrome)